MKSFGSTLILLGVMSLSVACNDEEPASERTSGGENAFETAEKNLNEAQQDFEEDFKEEREFVDEKANKAAAEGRKAAQKVGDALTGDEEADEPEPGKS